MFYYFNERTVLLCWTHFLKILKIDGNRVYRVRIGDNKVDI